MYKKNERLRYLYITAIRFLADDLYRRGVRKLYIRISNNALTG